MSGSLLFFLVSVVVALLGFVLLCGRLIWATPDPYVFPTREDFDRSRRRAQ